MEVGGNRDLGEALTDQRRHLPPIEGCWVLATTEPELIDGGVVDRSQQGPVGVDQAHCRAPVRDSGKEVIRAVDWVDVPGAAIAPLARTFLTHESVVGPALGKPAANLFLARVIRG